MRSFSEVLVVEDAFLKQQRLDMVPQFWNRKKLIQRWCSISLRVILLWQGSGISDFHDVPILYIQKAWNWVCKSFFPARLIFVNSDPSTKGNCFSCKYVFGAASKQFCWWRTVTVLSPEAVQRKALLKQSQNKLAESALASISLSAVAKSRFCCPKRSCFQRAGCMHLVCFMYALFFLIVGW